jgi:hypothetical protein
MAVLYDLIRMNTGRCPSYLLLAVLLGSSGCHSNAVGQDELAQEFSRARACSSTDEAARRLVWAFILSESDYLPDERRVATAKPFLERLSQEREDPFVVYHDYKRVAQPMIDANSYGAPQREGFELMDLYARSNADFSKTEIKCEVSPISFARYGYIGQEVGAFPVLTAEDGKKVRAVTVSVFLTWGSRDLRVLTRSFAVKVLMKGGGVAQTNVGGSKARQGDLESVPDFFSHARRRPANSQR